MMVSPTNQAEYRPVVPGPQIEGKRVIKEGLKAGERYIANGHGRIFMPGSAVIEDKAAAAPKTTASSH
jgi:multidrug efflux pump subunit AcrA (membrane-fusion protein)